MRFSNRWQPEMLIRFGLAPRRAGMSSADFQAYWKEKHPEVVRGMPGLTLYRQNHAVLRDGEPLLPWPGFDACAQFGADSVAGFDQAFSSPHYLGPVSADARQFVDNGRGGSLWCRQCLQEGFVDAPAGGDRVRLLTFLRLAPMASLGALEAGLGVLAAPAQALGREVFVAVTDGQHFSVFDAVDVLCFPDADAALRHVAQGESRQRLEPIAGLVRGTERLIAQVVRIL